jgi:hypothetical protein
VGATSRKEDWQGDKAL